MADETYPYLDQSSSLDSPSPPLSDSSSSLSPPPPSPPEEESSSLEGSSSPPPPPSDGDNNSNNDDDNNGDNNQSQQSNNENNNEDKRKKSSSKKPKDESVILTPPGSTLNPPTSSSITNANPSSNGNRLVIGIVVGGGILLLLMVVCIIFMRKKKKKGGGDAPPSSWDTIASNPPQGNQYWQTTPQDHAVKMPPSGGFGYPSTGNNGDSEQQSWGSGTSLAPSPSLTLGFNKSTFTYDELAKATNGFDKAYMLGQGGFGYVHKGVLPNGKEIAVKSLKIGSGQGEREFQAEVDIISRVHHRHLVSLVGYCIAGGQRMLVYEFVPNDTLEFHLHKKGELDFSTRLRIALGGAKGLAYLHEDCHPRIIHRDIKASNILLDENYEAMVADFGLAKLTTDTNTHVSTRVMGTFGYLAPEYASSGKLTEKSDVFSFGVMLLEIISGRRPVDPNMNYMEDSLVDWLRPLLAKSLETNDYHEFADPRMEGNYDPNLMKRLVACAAAAIRHSSKKRPKMSQIVRALEGDVSLDALNDGPKSGQSGMGSLDASFDYDTRAYSEDLKKFRQMAFETKDFASSEYGGTTSEYGLNLSSSSSDNSRDMNSRNME